MRTKRHIRDLLFIEKIVRPLFVFRACDMALDSAFLLLIFLSSVVFKRYTKKIVLCVVCCGSDFLC